MGIERFTPAYDYGEGIYMDRDEHGDWVDVDDYLTLAGAVRTAIRSLKGSCDMVTLETVAALERVLRQLEEES